MESLMKKFFKSSLFISTILIILGFLLVFKSDTTIMMISYIIGGVLVAIGILALIRYIRAGESPLERNELDIVYGIVTVIFGIIIIQSYQAVASVIPAVLGVAIIINSAGKLNYAFQLKDDENRMWKTTMVVAIISVIFGVILLFNPFEAALSIMKIIGIVIISGINMPTMRTKNSVLKFRSRLYKAIWILENAANGIQIHDIAITSPCPLLPTKIAISSAKTIIPIQISVDKMKLDQKATVVDW